MVLAVLRSGIGENLPCFFADSAGVLVEHIDVVECSFFKCMGYFVERVERVFPRDNIGVVAGIAHFGLLDIFPFDSLNGKI